MGWIGLQLPLTLAKSICWGPNLRKHDGIWRQAAAQGVAKSRKGLSEQQHCRGSSRGRQEGPCASRGDYVAVRAEGVALTQQDWVFLSRGGDQDSGTDRQEQRMWCHPRRPHGTHGACWGQGETIFKGVTVWPTSGNFLRSQFKSLGKGWDSRIEWQSPPSSPGGLSHGYPRVTQAIGGGGQVPGGWGPGGVDGPRTDSESSPAGGSCSAAVQRPVGHGANAATAHRMAAAWAASSGVTGHHWHDPEAPSGHCMGPWFWQSLLLPCWHLLALGGPRTTG